MLTGVALYFSLFYTTIIDFYCVFVKNNKLRLCVSINVLVNKVVCVCVNYVPVSQSIKY